MLKQLLICFLAIQLTTQTCSTGCLACDKATKCKLCDSTKNYYLSQNMCKMVTSVPNCAIYNLNPGSLQGKCKKCDSTTYLQFSSNKCVAVDTTKVPNCSHWVSATSCAACSTGFVLVGAACKAVTAVPNCISYTSQTKCGKCASSFILDTTANTCTAVTDAPVANCAGYSAVQCDKCAAKFWFNPNLDYETTNVSNLQTTFNEIQNTTVGNYYANMCQSVTDENCITRTAYNQCTACKKDYYLNVQTKACMENPKILIPQCILYSSETVCSICEQGYYVSNSKCSAVTTVANCAQYDSGSGSNKGKCIKCADTHHLNGLRNCVDRVKSKLYPSECTVLALDQDICKVAKANTVFYKDAVLQNGTVAKANLYPSLDANCDRSNTNNYTFNQKTTESVTSIIAVCNKCNKGYFVLKPGSEPATCSQGDVSTDFCMVYDQTQVTSASSTKCIECGQGYTLNSSHKCIANNKDLKVPDCSVESVTKSNTCNVCKAGQFVTKVLKKCNIQSTSILNCAQYKTDLGTADNKRQCLKCNDGYKLSAASVGNSCISLNTLIPNCLQVKNITDHQKCVKCSKNNRPIITDPAQTPVVNIGCQKVQTALTQSCNKLSDDSLEIQKMWGNSTCSQCQQNYVPQKLTNQYVCVNKNDAALLTKLTPVDNCSHYKWVSDKYVCYKCEATYGLNAGACVKVDFSNLVAPCLKLTLWTGEGQQNVCSSTANGVKYDTQSGTGDHHSRAIVECQSTHQPVIAPNTTVAATKYHNLESNRSIKDLFTQKYAPDSCVSGMTKNPATNTNCNLWALSSGTTYNCFKCADGYTTNGESATTVCDKTQSQGCQVDNYAPAYWQARTGCTSCTGNSTPYLMVGGIGNLVNHSLIDTSIRAHLGTNGWTAKTDASQNSNYTGCLSDLQASLGLQNSPVQDSATHSQIPRNCGLLVIDKSKAAAQASLPEKAVRCAYCKKGFKPTYHEDDTQWVKSCTQIANCAEGMPNGCKSCADGYAFKVDSKLNITECIQKDNNVAVPTNCLALNISTKKCVVCKKGYQLDQDKNCHKFQIQMCNGFKNSVNYTPLAVNNYHTLNLYLTNGLPGCSECQTSYVGVVPNVTTSAGEDATKRTLGVDWCVQTLEFTAGLSSTVSTTASPLYVADCKYYTGTVPAINNSYTCAECNAGYQLTTDKKRCEAQTTDAGCVQFANDVTTNGCAICRDTQGSGTNFYSRTVNGVKATCQNVTIANCIKGSASGSSATVVCTQCAPGYYLSENADACVVSAIANCQHHVNNNEFKCVTCQEGFTLIKGDGVSSNVPNADQKTQARDYCYPIIKELGCDKSQTITVNGGQMQVECNSCDVAFNRVHTITKSETPGSLVQNQVCSKYSTIKDCSSYIVDTNINTIQGLQTSNFMCAECTANFYLNGKIQQKCIPRTAKYTKNCKASVINADKCKECEAGYYLNSSDHTCVKQPYGKIGCLAWQTSIAEGSTTVSAPFCVACDTSEYTYDQNSKSCIKQKNPVSNCAKILATVSEVIQIPAQGNNPAKDKTRYVSDCQTCAFGYLKTAQTVNQTDDYERNKCVAVTVADKNFCMTFSSLTSCATCKSKYKLVAIGTSTNKKCQVDTTYNQCETVDISGTCTLCKGRYYLDNGSPRKCTSQATTVITNCTQYSSATTCMTCADGTYLSASKTQCSQEPTGWDKNCMVQSAPAKKACSKCMSGYTLSVSNGVYSCVALTGAQSPSNGCLMGNSADASKCLICKTGYHQTNTQTCVSNSGTTKPTTNNSGVNIFRTFVALSAVLSMIF